MPWYWHNEAIDRAKTPLSLPYTYSIIGLILTSIIQLAGLPIIYSALFQIKKTYTKQTCLLVSKTFSHHRHVFFTKFTEILSAELFVDAGFSRARIRSSASSPRCRQPKKKHHPKNCVGNKSNTTACTCKLSISAICKHHKTIITQLHSLDGAEQMNTKCV